MTDCAGFFAYRPYPPGSQLSGVSTHDGRPAVRCLIQFVVDPPRGASGSVSRVQVHARFSRRWNPGRIWSTTDPDAHDAADPDAPNPQSVVLLKKARRPLDLDFVDDYIYDLHEDKFIDDSGNVVRPEQILESVYVRHCRTCNWRFLIRWKADSAIKWSIRHSVWGGQDAAMWLLLNLYDVELQDKDLRSPFHKYKPGEFRRVTEKPDERSQFFGFQTSRKSFFTNLVIVAAACSFIYLGGFRTGIIRAIYNNTALRRPRWSSASFSPI